MSHGVRLALLGVLPLAILLLGLILLQGILLPFVGLLVFGGSGSGR